MPQKQQQHPHGVGYHQFSRKEISTFRSSLVSWYKANRRQLPWRGDKPPYSGSLEQCTIRVFSISKISLPKENGAHAENTGGKGKRKRAREGPNQVPVTGPLDKFIVMTTRREKGASKQTATMVKKENIKEEEKDCGKDEVNELWAGLGYYRRAANLRKGAQTIMKDFNGKLPDTVSELKAVPLVDGNVIRVLARVRAVKANKGNPKFVKHVWSLARELVSPEYPADFNQGIMELGATICKPKSPNCALCPIKDICHAYQEVNKQRRPLSIEYDLEGSAKECDFCQEEDIDSEDKSSADKNSNNPVLGTVMQYPSKFIKKKPREEHVAVGVVICTLDKAAATQNSDNDIDHDHDDDDDDGDNKNDKDGKRNGGGKRVKREGNSHVTKHNKITSADRQRTTATTTKAVSIDSKAKGRTSCRQWEFPTVKVEISKSSSSKSRRSVLHNFLSASKKWVTDSQLNDVENKKKNKSLGKKVHTMFIERWDFNATEEEMVTMMKTTASRRVKMERQEANDSNIDDNGKTMYVL
eukprot:jgi/Bigna1/82562/fgenesh1_pg.94_\